MNAERFFDIYWKARTRNHPVSRLQLVGQLVIGAVFMALLLLLLLNAR